MNLFPCWNSLEGNFTKNFQKSIKILVSNLLIYDKIEELTKECISYDK